MTLNTKCAGFQMNDAIELQAYNIYKFNTSYA